MSIVFGGGIFGGGAYGGASVSVPVGSSATLTTSGYAATLAFSPESNDLAFPPAIVRGDDATRQKIRQLFRFFEGEWFLDTRLGVPYFRRIFIKNPPIPLINAIFRRVLLSAPQVTTVTQLATTYDKTTRAGALDFDGFLDDGRTLTARQEPFIIPAP